jgi:hypothetical protein
MAEEDLFARFKKEKWAVVEEITSQKWSETLTVGERARSANQYCFPGVPECDQAFGRPGTLPCPPRSVASALRYEVPEHASCLADVAGVPRAPCGQSVDVKGLAGSFTAGQDRGR